MSGTLTAPAQVNWVQTRGKDSKEFVGLGVRLLPSPGFGIDHGASDGPALMITNLGPSNALVHPEPNQTADNSGQIVGGVTLTPGDSRLWLHQPFDGTGPTMFGIGGSVQLDVSIGFIDSAGSALADPLLPPIGFNPSSNPIQPLGNTLALTPSGTLELSARQTEGL